MANLIDDAGILDDKTGLLDDAGIMPKLEDDAGVFKSSALDVFGRSLAQASPVGIGKAIATGKPLFSAEDFAEQAEHPVANFLGRALGGTATFGMASLISAFAPQVGLPVAFGAAGALSQVGSQAERIAMDPSYQPNAPQLAGGQALSGGAGALTGKVFGSGVKIPFTKNMRFGGNVAPTLAGRVGQVAGGAGAISGAETLGQQAIMKEELDPQAAAVNGAVTALSIGILKGIIEYPQLRNIVIKDARSLSGNNKLNYNQAKSFLKNSTTINPEKLSPQLQSAIKEIKVEAAIKDAKILAQKYGVPDNVIKAVLRDRNIKSRLNTFDNWIYKESPQIKAKLAPFRKAIGSGADPADVLMFLEVRDKLIPGSQVEYVSPQSKLAVSKLKLQTEGTKGVVTAKGLTENAGVTTEITPIVKPSPITTQAAEAVLSLALNKLREQNPAVPIFTKLNAGHRNALLSEIAGSTETMTEGQIVESLISKMNKPGEIWLESMHKADDPKANIWDAALLQNTTIHDFALRNKNIDPNDIVVRRNLVLTQKPGIADTVRKTILEEIEKENKRYPPPLGGIPVSPPPPPTQADIAEQAGMESLKRQAEEPTPTPTPEPIVEPGAIPQGKQGIVEDKLKEFFKDKKQEKYAGEGIEKFFEKEPENIEVQFKKDKQGEIKERIDTRSGFTITDKYLRLMPPKEGGQQPGVISLNKEELKKIFSGKADKTEIEKQQKERIAEIEKEKAIKERMALESKASLGKFILPEEVTEDEDTDEDTEEDKKDVAEQERWNHGMREGYEEQTVGLLKELETQLDSLKMNLSLLKAQNAPSVKIKAAEKHIKEVEDWLNASRHDLKEAPPPKLTDAESTGGFSFTNSEDFVLETDQGPRVLKPGAHDLFQSEDKKEYYIVLEDIVYSVKPSELSKLYDNPTISFEAMDYYKSTQSDHNNWLNDRLSPLTNEEGGFRTVRKKGIQIPGVPEKIRTTTILSILRKFPNSDNIINFLFTQDQIAAMERKFEPYVPTDEIKGKLFDGAKYMDAVKILAWEKLRPVWNDLWSNLNNLFDQFGIKGKTERQEAAKVYFKLMASASAQIKMDSYGTKHDWTYHAKGRHPNGHRSDEDAVEAYVSRVKMFYDYFSIPVQDQIPEGNKDTPEGFSNTLGTLRYGRDPVFWNLLNHPNIMINDSLQTLVKHVKSTIEMPFLEEQMRYGIYSTADIWANLENGYQRRSYSLLPGTPQAEAEKTGVKDVLSTDNQPKANFKTYEEFEYMSKAEGWRAVDDFILNSYDYIVNAMRSIKQAQLLGELLMITKPGPLEYTDKEWQKLLKNNPSPYSWHAVEHTTSPTITKEARRMSKLLGKRVEPTQVLTEAGYIQGRQFEGLAKKSRGTFEAPYVYASVYDMFATMFREQPSFKNLSKISKFMNVLRFWLTINPVDTIGPFVASSTVVKNPFMLVPKQVMIYGYKLPKAISKAPMIGYRVATGKSLPLPNRFAPENYALLQKFIEHGLVAASGWSNVVKSLIDRETSVLPEMQGRMDHLKDLFFSVGGLNTATFDYMIADEIFEGTKILYEQYREQGMTEENAIRRAVNGMNTSSYMMNRASVGKENALWRLLAFSRNFAMVPLRTISLIIRALPVVKPGFKKRAFRFRTGPFGSLLNPLLAAEETEIDGAIIGAHLLRTVASLLFMSMLLNGLRQYADSFKDDGILDEHGETGLNKDGSIDYAAKKRFMVNNPGPMIFSRRLPLQFKDIHGKPQYVDSQWYKLTKDMINILSTVVDPVMQAASKNPYFDTGRGLGAWMKSKSGVLASLTDLLQNKGEDGKRIISPDNFYSLKSSNEQLQRLWSAFYKKFVVPIGFKDIPFGLKPGTEGTVARTDDPVKNAQLILMDLTGDNIKKGWIFDSTGTSEEMRRLQMDVARQKQFEKDIPERRYFLTESAAQKLTPEDRKELFRAKTAERDWRKVRQNPAYWYKKENRKLIERFKKRMEEVNK